MILKRIIIKSMELQKTTYLQRLQLMAEDGMAEDDIGR